MVDDRLVIALDQGTTSSRSIAFDANGALVATAQLEFQQHYPKRGWVEHEPADLWRSQRDTLAAVLANPAVRGRSVAALGIANQRETVVLWDRDSGQVVYRAIVWQDRRTSARCRTLADAGHEAVFRERTGLRLDPYFSGTKLTWLLDEIPGARDRAAAGDLCFGTVDSWLIWNLTGGAVHATDPSNASRTLLYNLHTGEWDDELLALLDIPRACLPEVRASSGDFGVTACEGLPRDLPLRGVAGDQQAALFGQRCFDVGDAKNTYGTGCFLMLQTGDTPVMSSNNLLTTVAWDLGNGPCYALEGSVFIGGAVVQWLRDELKMIDSAEQCSALAATVADTNGLILVPAFVGLGAPYWDPQARGLAIGITRGTTSAHWCRAALEAIAFQSAELFEAQLADVPASPIAPLRVDGGATASEPLMQFQADLLQRPVVRPAITETTARGVAFLAGLAAGVWENADALRTLDAGTDTVFEPRRPAAEMQAALAAWKRAVARSRGWAEA